MAEGPVTISRYEERLTNQEARWYFTKEELSNSPSRVHGVDPAKELSYRQQAANLIQDMGHRLNLNGQLCTATAIVYMHRFFMVHSFKAFQRFNVATAALFLAAKVEEQPRKLEYVTRVSYACQNRDSPPLEGQSDTCKKLMEEVSFNELLLLETLGFELAVEHPHAHVVEGTQLVRASKDLSQTAYFMSHNSLLLTTFCLQYPPTVVACVCIHIACRWKGVEIPLSADGKNWWQYIDRKITLEELNDHTSEFLKIYEMCPSRLQKKIMESVKMGQQQSKVGEHSKSHSSMPHPMSRPSTSGDKTKGHASHPFKHKPQPSSNSQSSHQKLPGKSGHGATTQPHKHSIPGKHPQQQTSHSGPTVQQISHGTSSHQAPSHSGDSKPHLFQHPRPTTHQKPPNRVTQKPLKPHEDHHRHKTANSDSKHHHNASQPKHHHHHHPHVAAPGHIPNAAKPSDVLNKHRLLAGDHKHRPSGNHEGRHGNPLKRPHPMDNHEVKRVKLEVTSSGSLPLLPPESFTNDLTLPPLPTQSPMDLPPPPPPLPTDPPPNPWGVQFSPPPPPPPN